MDNEMLWGSLKSLYSWVKMERYKGWDPYDGLEGKIKSKNGLLNILLIQLNLYSPINLRPLLGIKKGCSNKALALFSRAYLLLYGTTGREEFKIEAKRLLNDLERQNLERGNKFSCASYYFPYVAPKHRLASSLPDIICVTEAMKSFVTAYEILGKEKYLSLALKAKNFLMESLLESSEKVVYFKYTPEEEGKVVFNVSSLALEAIGMLLEHAPGEDVVKTSEMIVEFIINNQRKDGAWPYSYYFGSSLYYWQIDYHQGFIIDGLTKFLPYIENKSLKVKCKKAILNGANFYMKKQFTPEGVSHYRYPIKYPIDIHNQAQGIITFSKLYEAFHEQKYLNFAEKIAEWTIKNMQDPSGYFYTHKWPGFLNKIPYMRWAQAWMMLALSTLVRLREYEGM